MASPDDINSTLQGIVRNISNEVAAIQAISTAILTTGAVTAILGISTAILTTGAAEVVGLQGISTSILTTGAAQLTVLQAISSAVANIATAIYSTFPRINGTFTLSAATTTVVTQPAISASGWPLWSPTNATAALIVRTNGLFLASVSAGASFTLSTQSGSATAGGTFSYIVFNPS